MCGIAHAEGLAARQGRLIPIANRVPAERVSQRLATRPFERRGEPRVGGFQGDARGCLGALVQKKNAGEDTRYANHKIQSETRAATWASLARARPSRLYPPSSTETRRPAQCVSASSSISKVSSPKSSSVSKNWPSGSWMRESKRPRAGSSRDGRLRQPAAAVRGTLPALPLGRSPREAGNFSFPAPAPTPVSPRAPVPGYQGDWCVLKNSTEPSA